MNFSKARFARLIYSTIMYLMTPLMVVYLLWRGRKAPAYLRRWSERFGFRVPNISNVIWLHAVSVGETLAAIPLVRMIQKHFPSARIVFTTTTPTGSERVKNTFGDSVSHVYVPYDFPVAVDRFIRAVNPRLLIVMETEFWPNIFYHCGRRHIPIIVANARISERSFKRYRRFSVLTQSTLSYVTAFVAQSNQDAARLIQMGAPKSRVRVTGNLKYDLAVSDEVLQQGKKLREEIGARPVWIAASTHRGEDEIILQVFRRLRRTWPDLLLILVPRHPERFAEAAALCQQFGFTLVKRSDGLNCNAFTQVYLGDTMGELMLLYAASDIAFVGGSLIPHGGQNMLEPASLSKPVVFGEYTGNFAEITERLLEAQGAQRVNDADQLYDFLCRMLQNPVLRERMGANAAAVVAANRGALKTLFVLISPVLLHAAQEQAKNSGKLEKQR